MSGVKVPGTTYEVHTIEGSDHRSLYQASTAGATPGVVCQCVATSQQLRQCVAKTAGFSSNGFGDIVTARKFCHDGAKKA